MVNGSRDFKDFEFNASRGSELALLYDYNEKE
jgi:hypothetical protein